MQPLSVKSVRQLWTQVRRLPYRVTTASVRSIDNNVQRILLIHQNEVSASKMRCLLLCVMVLFQAYAWQCPTIDSFEEGIGLT